MYTKNLLEAKWAVHACSLCYKPGKHSRGSHQTEQQKNKIKNLYERNLLVKPSTFTKVLR